MTKDLTPISDRLQSVLDLIPADSYISGSELQKKVVEIHFLSYRTVRLFIKDLIDLGLVTSSVDFGDARKTLYKKINGTNQ